MLCVLLKKSLYCGNNLWIWLVDLVADSLVSCMVIIEGGLWRLVIESCRHGMAVLREEAFHVIAYVPWLVSGGKLVDGGKVCVRGG